MKYPIILFSLYILLITNSVMALTINEGVVLNTTSSNSSITFSFNITATNFTVESGAVLIYGITFSNSTGTYTCNSVNNSVPNSNTDSSEFNCTLQTLDGGSSNPSGGGCSYKWNCTDWNNCLSSGKQTRICTNLGTCSDSYKTPEIEQNCNYIAPEINKELDRNVTEKEGETKKQNETDEDIIKEEIVDKNKIILYSIILLIISFIIFYLKKNYFKKRTCLAKAQKRP